MRAPRQRLLAAVAATVVVVAAVGGWRIAHRSQGPAPAPVAEAARRRALIELRGRVVPSVAGGWVVESPAAEPDLVGWLLASSQDTASSDSFTTALTEADRVLARPSSADAGEIASLGLALAQVLPGPTADRSLADGLARDVAARAERRLARGEATWLGPLLQLSAGRSPSAGRAMGAIEARAGGPACSRLPEVGAVLPPPSSVMTVALRTLAAAGVRCEGAGPLLDAALQDPTWDTWVASPELADLAAVARGVPAATRRALARRLDGFLEVGPDHPIDLGSVVTVQAARRRLDLPTDLPPQLRWHLDGQVASRGGLPGRAAAPPTAFDVAVQRQLVGERLLARQQLAATVEAVGPPSGGEPLDPVVETLLVGGPAPACGDAPARSPVRTRVTFEGVVADEAWAVVRSWCKGDLDLERTVDRQRARRSDDLRVLRMAVAELTACRLERAALTAVQGRVISSSGPFATDSLLVWASAIAADPVAACDALHDT